MLLYVIAQLGLPGPRFQPRGGIELFVSNAKGAKGRSDQGTTVCYGATPLGGEIFEMLSAMPFPLLFDSPAEAKPAVLHLRWQSIEAACDFSPTALVDVRTPLVFRKPVPISPIRKVSLTALTLTHLVHKLSPGRGCWKGFLLVGTRLHNPEI
jgi:hypothetical protein